jgi:uncharacterized protein
LPASRPWSGPVPESDGEHELQFELGTRERAARFYGDQVLDHLNEAMRDFVARQEMLFLATSDRRGECDSSLRAGPPGFIQVLDATTLAYPEYRGNGVMASLGNIRENGHAGLLMVDFFADVIGLHVNGRARVLNDHEARRLYPLPPADPHPGRAALLWVVLDVEEAYIHCSKHIPALVKRPGGRYWGSDDERRKGGDFFASRQTPRRE